MTKEQISEYTRKISQASRSEIIVIMYELAIEYMKDAQQDNIKGNHEDMRKNSYAAIKVINDLIGALDFNYELALPLYRVYEYISKEISWAVIKDDGRIMDKCIQYLSAIRESFIKVADNDKSGPIMDNTQTVYAGLTYGKGILNESIAANNQNRGYSV